MAVVEFPFVLELLHPKKLTARKMFGATAFYSGEKILFVFRLKDDHTDDNGVWIATYPEHHESLAQDFPSMRSIRIFGKNPTAWQNLPLEERNFEASVEKLCELIKKGDPRIGKVPDKKKRSRSTQNKTAHVRRKKTAKHRH